MPEYISDPEDSSPDPELIEVKRKAGRPIGALTKRPDSSPLATPAGERQTFRKNRKVWGLALRRALMRCVRQDGVMRRRLDILADSVVRRAIKGNMAAVAEIGNRLDGRQAATIDADDAGDMRLIINIQRNDYAEESESGEKAIDAIFELRDGVRTPLEAYGSPEEAEEAVISDVRVDRTI